MKQQPLGMIAGVGPAARADTNAHGNRSGSQYRGDRAEFTSRTLRQSRAGKYDRITTAHSCWHQAQCVVCGVAFTYSGTPCGCSQHEVRDPGSRRRTRCGVAHGFRHVIDDGRLTDGLDVNLVRTRIEAKCGKIERMSARHVVSQRHKVLPIGADEYGVMIQRVLISRR